MAEKELLSNDGRRRVRITARDDGSFVVWEDVLALDPEEDVTYWSQPMHPLPGIYESIELALSEVLTWLAYRPYRPGD